MWGMAGQSEAAASTRPTAREMSRVADESNLLEIVYKFSGMYVDLQVLPWYMPAPGIAQGNAQRLLNCPEHSQACVVVSSSWQCPHLCNSQLQLAFRPRMILTMPFPPCRICMCGRRLSGGGCTTRWWT